VWRDCITLMHSWFAQTIAWRFYRAMLCIRGTSHGPVSVCPSVTSQTSTKTAEWIELIYCRWASFREKFHLVELNVLIKFHQNNQKVIYFWRFDLYQRPSSEEAGARSFSGSWRDKLEWSQESGCTYDWVGSSLRPGSWIVDLPSGYELPPWSIW